MWMRALLVCGLLCVASAARAQTVTDERVWFVLTMQERPVEGDPWRWSYETILRSRDGVGALDVFTVRPTLHYAITSSSTIGAGYAASSSFPASGGATAEQRVFGQYVWSGRGRGWSIGLRTRLEARFIEGNSGTLGRLRQQVRVSRPLRTGSRFQFVASDELLVHVNNTSRTARGVDQNRVFAGLGVALGAARLEAGYLNQFSPGHRGAADRMNHILSTALSASF